MSCNWADDDAMVRARRCEHPTVVHGSGLTAAATVLPCDELATHSTDDVPELTWFCERHATEVADRAEERGESVRFDEVCR